jgi:hypothetical protein
MAQRLPKSDFLRDLRGHIQQHCAIVEGTFQPLSKTHLNWQHDAKQWSIGQCFDHLNLTHAYYRPRIGAAMGNPPPAPSPDTYSPAFWGRIYMRFAFNPRYSFPTPSVVVPASALDATVLLAYLQTQRELLGTLEQVASIDLNAAPIPIKSVVKFNLGDALKILVYHDALHIRQAGEVLKRLRGGSS